MCVSIHLCQCLQQPGPGMQVQSNFRQLRDPPERVVPSESSMPEGLREMSWIEIPPPQTTITTRHHLQEPCNARSPWRPTAANILHRKLPLAHIPCRVARGGGDTWTSRFQFTTLDCSIQLMPCVASASRDTTPSSTVPSSPKGFQSTCLHSPP